MYGSMPPSERRAAVRKMPTVAFAAAAMAVIALAGVALVASSRGAASSVSFCPRHPTAGNHHVVDEGSCARVMPEHSIDLAACLVGAAPEASCPSADGEGRVHAGAVR